MTVTDLWRWTKSVSSSSRKSQKSLTLECARVLVGLCDSEAVAEASEGRPMAGGGRIEREMGWRATGASGLVVVAVVVVVVVVALPILLAVILLLLWWW